MRKSSLSHISYLIVVFGLMLSCSSKKDDRIAEDVIIKVTNPLSESRESVLFSIPGERIAALDGAFFRVYNGDKEIPSQLLSNKGERQLTCLLENLKADETIELRVVSSVEEPTYSKRTQAELSHKTGGHFENREYIGGQFQNVDSLHVPAEHTDHSWFIRYEGPGWESDRVGYRFYLDWRNGIDVFGKKVATPVLQNVGQDGFDSYHEPASWGMDVLKVGKTLGLGSIAHWVDRKAQRVEVTDSLYAEVAENGSIYSAINTRYYGWQVGGLKTDLESKISIHAGTRMSKMELISSEALPNLATGLIKDSKAELIKSDQSQRFSYMATFGPQSLAGDQLGIAVLFPTAQLMEMTEDDLSHVVVLKPDSGKSLTYYFLAAWEQEPEGIKDKAAFVAYLDRMVLELSNPVVSID